MNTDLAWLPVCDEWNELLAEARGAHPEVALPLFQRLANTRMDVVRAGRLDRAFRNRRAEIGAHLNVAPLRFALLASSTSSHLHAGIRLGALRRGLLVDIFESPYGQYRQELAQVDSGLRRFAPDVICFAFDQPHLTAQGCSAHKVLADLVSLWEQARSLFGCAVLQQTVLPRNTFLVGNGEDRLGSSPSRVTQQINAELRETAAHHSIHLLTVDAWVMQEGLSFWHDPALWNSSKHDVHPRASQIFGDQVGRVLGALRGRSAKCLVLDLDNTLWGGVIGDDGLEGIVLGQGSATGEAHLAVQQYARDLSRRGIILAVCSKNDDAVARTPFEQHAEMLLRAEHIACFVASWRDKAAGLREIAERLNIGLDSLVFVDDNPMERALVRRELPMVAVPELPDDPSLYVNCLVNAGYFEAVEITAEDAQRAELYRANAARDASQKSATDLKGFLQELRMELTWSSFDDPSLKRIVQLINKTNQFNLTTARLTEAEVSKRMADTDYVTMQLRLKDAYGDNGMVGVVIGKITADQTLDLETWLMSCRVLGREMELATLNIVAEQARVCGCTHLRGRFLPTAKNGMVRDHYQRLGFDLEARGRDESSTWSLSLQDFVPRPHAIQVLQGDLCKAPLSIAS